jgi:hypothetical protein
MGAWAGSHRARSPGGLKLVPAFIRREDAWNEDIETPILCGEGYEWAAIPNLDVFFSRLYRQGPSRMGQKGGLDLRHGCSPCMVDSVLLRASAIGVAWARALMQLNPHIHAGPLEPQQARIPSPSLCFQQTLATHGRMGTLSDPVPGPLPCAGTGRAADSWPSSSLGFSTCWPWASPLPSQPSCCSLSIGRRSTASASSRTLATSPRPSTRRYLFHAPPRACMGVHTHVLHQQSQREGCHVAGSKQLAKRQPKALPSTLLPSLHSPASPPPAIVPPLFPHPSPFPPPTHCRPHFPLSCPHSPCGTEGGWWTFS